MTLEVQVREVVLAQALGEEMQRQVFTLCVPLPSPHLYVDHLDTVAGSARLSTAPGVGLDVSLEVVAHLVTEAEVVAHPNAAAATQTGIIRVVVRLGVVDSKLIIVRAWSNASALPGPQPLRTAIQSALDARLAQLSDLELIDAAPIVTTLTPLAPSAPDLVHGQGIVALRFGGVGPATNHLGSGQEWGIFLDASEATGLIERRLPPGLPTRAVWQPQGAAPSIALTLSFDLGFVGRANGVATATPQFRPPSLLRLAVSWGVDLSGIASLLEPVARWLIRRYLRNRIPEAVHDGARSFYFDVSLPPAPSFLGARAQWAGITSTAAGLTIGGPVVPAPSADRGLLELSVHRFGPPVWWGNCRDRARIGDGEPPRQFHRSDPRLRVTAGAGLVDPGAVCNVRLRPPNESLDEWMSVSAAGVSFNLTLGQAAAVTSDIHVLVATARGCRLVDLGIPDVRIDEDGNVEVQVNWFDNCLYLDGPRLKLAVGEALTPDDFRPVPLEDPDWKAELNAIIGLDSHLLTAGGLEPGDLSGCMVEDCAWKLLPMIAVASSCRRSWAWPRPSMNSPLNAHRGETCPRTPRSPPSR